MQALHRPFVLGASCCSTAALRRVRSCARAFKRARVLSSPPARGRLQCRIGCACVRRLRLASIEGRTAPHSNARALSARGVLCGRLDAYSRPVALPAAAAVLHAAAHVAPRPVPTSHNLHACGRLHSWSCISVIGHR